MSQVIRMGATGAIGIPMITAAALFVVLMFQAYPVDAGERPVAAAAGKPVRRIRVVLPSKAGSEMRKIAAETPRPRATDARSRGIKFPISNKLRRCVVSIKPVTTDRIRITAVKAPVICELRLYNEKDQ